MVRSLKIYFLRRTPVSKASPRSIDRAVLASGIAAIDVRNGLVASCQNINVSPVELMVGEGGVGAGEPTGGTGLLNCQVETSLTTVLKLAPAVVAP